MTMGAIPATGGGATVVAVTGITGAVAAGPALSGAVVAAAPEGAGDAASGGAAWAVALAGGCAACCGLCPPPTASSIELQPARPAAVARRSSARIRVPAGLKPVMRVVSPPSAGRPAGSLLTMSARGGQGKGRIPRGPLILEARSRGVVRRNVCVGRRRLRAAAALTRFDAPPHR